MPPKAKATGRAKAPAKRKLAEEFPPGEVLTDTGKKSWKLGAPVGQGGFGLIYLGEKSFTVRDKCISLRIGFQIFSLSSSSADQNSDKSVGKDAPYVIKVVRLYNVVCFSTFWHFLC